MAENQERQIQTAINKLLLRDSRDTGRFHQKVENMQERFGDAIYASLLFTTAHLEYQKRTARRLYREVLEHWEKMRLRMKREIDFRVALLDYFIDINKRIKNPKIIEIAIFQKTQQETLIDELTQLYNYRYFMKALDHEIARARRYRAPLSLVIFDVDDFKNYNDTNGHLSGNRALRKLAQIARKSVRDVDIVARYGGEEFAMILPETNKEGGLTISERIRKKVERGAFVNREKQPLKKFTISGGVATLQVDAVTGPELIKKADLALYRAKAVGKNHISPYMDERRDFDRVAASITGRLTMASDSGDIFVVENVSEGGVLFRFHKPIPLGSVLHLFLNLPRRKTPIHCKAKVRRVEELLKNKRYEIGASFIQILESERKAMKRFIHGLAQEKEK